MMNEKIEEKRLNKGGNPPMRQTFMAKAEEIERNWYVVDAEGKRLGRLATEVASILRGKNKPEFTPHVDTGDHVIIINAEKIELTGNKLTDKMYYSHSGHPGGLKSTRALEMRKNKPVRMVELAVQGMLPKNALGRQTIKKLHVYEGPNHKHEAQKPESYELRG